MRKTLMLVVLASSLALAFDSNQDGSIGDSDDSPAAVPEPATIGLMGVGIAAIGFAAWRKNRKG